MALTEREMQLVVDALPVFESRVAQMEKDV